MSQPEGPDVREEEPQMRLLWYVLVFALAMVLGWAALSTEAADVNVSGGVSIQIGTPPPPPPPVIVQAPPAFVVIPGSVVSYAPSLKVDLFFHEGKYYYFHNGAWFIAKAHTGPWAFVASPPPVIVQIPVAYYKVPPGHLKKIAAPPGHERGGRGKWKGKD